MIVMQLFHAFRIGDARPVGIIPGGLQDVSLFEAVSGSPVVADFLASAWGQILRADLGCWRL